jgi:hypothetical protein
VLPFFLARKRLPGKEGQRARDGGRWDGHAWVLGGRRVPSRILSPASQDPSPAPLPPPTVHAPLPEISQFAGTDLPTSAFLARTRLPGKEGQRARDGGKGRVREGVIWGATRPLPTAPRTRCTPGPPPCLPSIAVPSPTLALFDGRQIRRTGLSLSLSGGHEAGWRGWGWGSRAGGWVTFPRALCAMEHG